MKRPPNTPNTRNGRVITKIKTGIRQLGQALNEKHNIIYPATEIALDREDQGAFFKPSARIINFFAPRFCAVRSAPRDTYNTQSMPFTNNRRVGLYTRPFGVRA